jgi:isopentenyl phosphate kinase
MIAFTLIKASLILFPSLITSDPVPNSTAPSSTSTDNLLDEKINVVVVKIGGSSITNKGKKESINQKSLDWFSRIISETVADRFKSMDAENKSPKKLFKTTRWNQMIKGASDDDLEKSEAIISRRQTAFVVIHGAGSFGHHAAKENGLSGQTEAPPTGNHIAIKRNRQRKRGLSETRLSVQKLNHVVVSTLLGYGVNAVGISPGFGVPGLEAHLHLQEEASIALERVIQRTLEAGLIPILHGDACLYGDDAAILSGDTLVEVLGSLPWVSEAIFITDVDGVFEQDPRQNPSAKLLKHISVDSESGEICMELIASGSSHEHDVTGGLEVSYRENDC